MQEVAFRKRLVTEIIVARRTYLGTQVEENKINGRARVCHPLFDTITIVVRKIEVKGGSGAQFGPTQHQFARLGAPSSLLFALGRQHKLYRKRYRIKDGWELLVAVISCDPSKKTEHGG